MEEEEAMNKNTSKKKKIKNKQLSSKTPNVKAKNSNQANIKE